MTSPRGSASGQRTRVLAVLLISFSIALLLIAVFQRDGLLGEELMLTLNVAGRCCTGLLQPLSYAQTAPIPFLWAERLAVQLNGVDQTVLRVLPFVAAFLTLIVLWAVASQLLRHCRAHGVRGTHASQLAAAFRRVLVSPAGAPSPSRCSPGCGSPGAAGHTSVINPLSEGARAMAVDR